MISEASIDQIRGASIIKVIGSYTKLKKHGSGKAMGSCPFHNEKTASFHVSDVKGCFKCFGCGEGGDALQFVMKHDRVDFMEAAEKIAQICGIPIDYEAGDKEAFNTARAARVSLREVLIDAHETYKRFLWTSEKPFQYLTDSRGMDRETISQWGLGYAPGEWRTLAGIYAPKGWLPRAIELGLCKETDQNHIDLYRNRIIFPILDTKGELVTFGGRTLSTDPKNPKYINGCESTLYSKSRILYGLYQGRRSIIDKGFAILVEGYTDVISMHRAGADNTICTCGTALTEDQARELKKITKEVMIMRDGDAAGLKATERDIHLLTAIGLRTDVIELEPGQDPDDYAKKFFPNPEMEEAEL